MVRSTPVFELSILGGKEKLGPETFCRAHYHTVARCQAGEMLAVSVAGEMLVAAAEIVS